MRFYFLSIFLWTLTILNFKPSCTAQEYGLLEYGVEEGLGASQVQAIWQDSKGYLWVATAAGVSRFDGETFTNYSSKDGLGNKQITAFFEDNKGNLWLQGENSESRNHLLRFDGKRFHNIPKKEAELFIPPNYWYGDWKAAKWIIHKNNLKIIHPDRSIILINGLTEFANSGIYDVHFINDRHIYLATAHGLVEYKEGVFTHHYEGIGRTTQVYQIVFFQDVYWLQTDSGIWTFNGKNFSNELTPEPLKRNITTSMRHDTNGNLWFATILGLYRYDGKNYRLFTTKDGLPENRLKNLFVDSCNNLWLPLENKIVVYNGDAFITVYEDKEMDYYQTRRRFEAWKIIEDKQGQVWFNTNQGIAKFCGFAFQHYHTENNFLTSKHINDILADKQGQLWIAYFRNGLSLCQGDSCKTYTTKEGLLSDNPIDIFEDDKGTVWLSFSNGIMSFSKGKFKIEEKNEPGKNAGFSRITQDSKGNLWFLAYNHVLRYDGKTSKQYRANSDTILTVFNNNVYTLLYDILIDQNDSIWLASNKGIYKLRNEKFELIGSHEHFGSVWSMKEDEQGNIWMIGGQSGMSVRQQGELLRFDGVYVTRFNEFDGLSSNNVRSLAIKDGFAWLGMLNGINKFNIKAYNENKQIHIEHIGKKEGFLPIECKGVAYAGPYGNLWFSTRTGLTRFNPSMYEYEHNRYAEIFISGIQLNYENTDWITYTNQLHPQTHLPLNLRLPYDENTLTFNFDAVSLGDPSKLRFQYQLTGLEDSLQAPTFRKQVTYNNLPPGQYLFKVQLFDQKEMPSVMAAFPFTILNPFWKQWTFWLKLSFVIFSLIILYFFLFFILKKRKQTVFLQQNDN